MINGMLSILSKASPVKNRLTAKVKNELLKTVAHEAKKLTMLKAVRAVTRPLWSATQPKPIPPTIDPQKKIAWAVETRRASLHTQSS